MNKQELAERVALISKKNLLNIIDIYSDKKDNRGIYQIVFHMGRLWVSFDRAGFMGWNGKKNFYFIYSNIWNKRRAF